ncbi:hypothetical protein ACBY01_12730 [Sphingomonas sp. ac-8]|uniref:hypothetical protein n=1 Tax=Sphingomonas sp. ac-8 TaxID=3242977 RepID=UPI003A804B90
MRNVNVATNGGRHDDGTMLTGAHPLTRLACTSLSAAGALMLAVPAGAVGTRVLVVETCHGGRIAIPIGDNRPGPDKQCQGGCHAACTRKREDADE